eukprot:gene19470-biopygen815
MGRKGPPAFIVEPAKKQVHTEPEAVKQALRGPWMDLFQRKGLHKIPQGFEQKWLERPGAVTKLTEKDKETMEAKITESEVREALRDLNPLAATTDFSVEVLRRAAPCHAGEIAARLDTIYRGSREGLGDIRVSLGPKGGSGEALDHRPLSITGCDLRLLHKILDTRLRAVLFSGGRRGTSPIQHAYQSHKGCDNVLAAYAAAWFSRKGPLYSVLVDLVKMNAQCHLKTAYGECEPYQRKTGLPQGDPICCTLALLYLQPVLVAIEEQKEEHGYRYGAGDARRACLAQADDITIISSTFDGIKRLFAIMKEWADDVGAELNEIKTQYLPVRQGKGLEYFVKRKEDVLVLEGQAGEGSQTTLKATQRARLLGIIFNAREPLEHSRNLLEATQRKLHLIAEAARPPETRIFYIHEL